MRRLLVLVPLALALLAGRAAHADVDWAAATVTTRGVGPADLRAPNADIARVAAERVALERGRVALGKALRSLPVAGGGKLGARAKAAEALAGLVDGAQPLERTLYSDGSVVVRFSLPLARVAEVALDAPAAGAAPAALVVRSKKAIPPALGYRVKAGATVRAAPVRFVASAGDAGEPASRIEARATRVEGGVIALDLEEARLAAPEALVVFVVRGDS
jgi:hypothetical protein